MFSHEDMAEAWDAWHPTRRRRIVKNESTSLGVVVSAGGRRSSGFSIAQTKAQLDRLTRRVPQVMVKVTKRKSGAAGVMSNFTYIGRHGKVDVETGDGEVITKRRDLAELAEDWDSANGARNTKRATSLGMILSMPEGTDAQFVHDAARAWGRGQFEGKHDFVFALHTDTPRPHVHFAVRIESYDRRRFNPGRAQLQAMREAFAAELRSRGIEADATPRLARGVTIANDRSNVYRARQLAVKHGEAYRRDIQPALEGWQLSKGLIPLNPFEVKTRTRLRDLSGVYTRMATALIGSPDAADVEIGRRLESYVMDIKRAPLSARAAVAFEIDRTSRDLKPDAIKPEGVHRDPPKPKL